MKPTYFIIIAVIISSLILTTNSCDEPEDPDPQQSDLVFESITADKDSIDIGETITFTANANGTNLTYNWTASAGVLLGSGQIVTYTPSPCIFGEIYITCIVKDAYNNSKTKDKMVCVREL